nr:O-fucosyltransferase 36-like [Tanacetum cinerariifolium]
MDKGESSSSSDEEQHLIHQNDVIPKSPHNHTFQIDNNKSPRHPFNYKNKTRYHYYLLAAISLIIIIILFFTSNYTSIFTTPLHADVATPDLMRESELRALSLLKHQQSRLLNLLNNHTIITKSALLDQISLNNEIQQALLSSHHSLYSDEYNVSDVTSCRKVEQNLADRRTIDQHAFEGAALILENLLVLFDAAESETGLLQSLITLNGKTVPLITRPARNSAENWDALLYRKNLMEMLSGLAIVCNPPSINHMFFAAVLGRVLVIPSAKVDYEFSRVLDIDHINKCVGREVVVTFEDFAERRKNRVRVDKVLCYFSLPQACYVDEEHVKKLKAIGVSMGELKTVWSDEDVKKPSYRTTKEVVDKFTCDDEVLAIGDVFFADVEKQWVMQPGGPIAHTCQTLIEPSRVILLTAQRFIQTFLGKDFVALHFRRHGFLKFWYLLMNNRSMLNFNVMDGPYAAESETGLLQSLITLNGKTVPLITRPARNSAEKWDALLYRKKLDGDTQVEAMLDKTISALSGVFIGAPGSTFTEDILRLRRGWGTASVLLDGIREPVSGSLLYGRKLLDSYPTSVS